MKSKIINLIGPILVIIALFLVGSFVIKNVLKSVTMTRITPKENMASPSGIMKSATVSASFVASPSAKVSPTRTK